MILKNKLTRETLEITYPEFRKKFAKEIQDAFESYSKTQLNTHITSKTIIQWNSTFTLNYIGTLITLEILIGILKE